MPGQQRDGQRTHHSSCSSESGGCGDLHLQAEPKRHALPALIEALCLAVGWETNDLRCQLNMYDQGVLREWALMSCTARRGLGDFLGCSPEPRGLTCCVRLPDCWQLPFEMELGDMQQQETASLVRECGQAMLCNLVALRQGLHPQCLQTLTT